MYAKIWNCEQSVFEILQLSVKCTSLPKVKQMQDVISQTKQVHIPFSYIFVQGTRLRFQDIYIYIERETLRTCLQVLITEVIGYNRVYVFMLVLYRRV